MKILKMLVIGVFALFALNSYSNQQEENNWTRENLKGEVKSCTEFGYYAKESFGNIVKGERLYSSENNYKMVFDKKSNLLEKSTYNSDLSLNTKFVYTYNKKGELIEMIEYTEYGNHRVTYKYENSYVVEERIYHYDGDSNLIAKWNNKYNGNNYLIKRSGSKYYWIYEYDENNNKIEESYYSSDGELDIKLTYKYDTKRNLIEESTYNSNGSLERKLTYIYDDNNYKVEESWLFPNNNENLKFVHNYDDKGNLIKTFISGSKGNTVLTYKYEFDEKGNWTQKITFENDVPKYFYEREYEYFK